MKDEKLTSWIPEDGTEEWARYVLDNYKTEYFKPVDITRATLILDRSEGTRNVSDNN